MPSPESTDCTLEKGNFSTGAAAATSGKWLVPTTVLLILEQLKWLS